MIACNIQHRISVLTPAVSLFVLVFGAIWLGGAPIAAAEEVECSSIRLEMKDGGYDVTCESDAGNDITFQTLQANASDGTHFLMVGDATTNYGYIFRSQGLRQSLTGTFDSLEVKDWHGGQGSEGLTTSEFTSVYKSIPSACVAFQSYAHKEAWGGGWRRHIIGFGCSRTGDRSKVYEALKLVNFPG
jgi:hypothetical protein